MSRTKEAELLSALCWYAARCWAEGDRAALREIGFGREEVEALVELTLADIHRMSTVKGHPLSVRLDGETFRFIVEHLRRERAAEATLRALIVADAPMAMMQHLYGMTDKDYTGWRQILEMPPAAGRPPDPDEAASSVVWHAWHEQVGERDPDSLEPAELLALHRTTGVAMRTIWTLVQRWAARGGPAGVEGRAAPGRPAAGPAERTRAAPLRAHGGE